MKRDAEVCELWNLSHLDLQLFRGATCGQRPDLPAEDVQADSAAIWTGMNGNDLTRSDLHDDLPLAENRKISITGGILDEVPEGAYREDPDASGINRDTVAVDVRTLPQAAKCYTLRSFVTRPVGTHSTTKILPSLS